MSGPAGGARKENEKTVQIFLEEATPPRYHGYCDIVVCPSQSWKRLALIDVGRYADNESCAYCSAPPGTMKSDVVHEALAAEPNRYRPRSYNRVQKDDDMALRGEQEQLLHQRKSYNRENYEEVRSTDLTPTIS